MPSILNVPGEFSSIQNAVEYSKEGDTIDIAPGNYYENFRIAHPITLSGEVGATRIFPKDVEHPIIIVDNITRSQVLIRSINFIGNKSKPFNKKIGLWIENSNIIIEDCQFTEWGLIADGSLPDEDEFWENLRITAIYITGEKTKFVIKSSKIDNCGTGIEIQNTKDVQIVYNQFRNCDEIAINISNTVAKLKNNIITDCSSVFWFNNEVNVESTTDTFEKNSEFIGSGNSSGIILLNNDSISTKSFLSLALGASLTNKQESGVWDIKAPKIILKNCILYLDSEKPLFRYAQSYNQNWGLPSISVFSLIEEQGNNQISIQKKEYDASLKQSDLPQTDGLYFLTTKNLDISGEFSEAYNLISSTSNSYFITGKAGTGKSTLLRYLVENTNKKFALLAPTGIAAVNIQGETIHSFFKFPPHTLTAEDIHSSGNNELYQSLETVIIDEVSMVRADLMDAIDKFMRRNGKKPNDPFGGVQVLLFGDIFQLQPVVAGEEEAKYFTSYYSNPYFFDAKVFDTFKFQIINLQKVYRQKDLNFVELLDSVRLGKPEKKQIDLLNTRFRPDIVPSDNSPHITLTSTNRRATEINEDRLSRIQDQEFSFIGTLEGEYPKKSLPTEMTLKLKRGAQVMFVKNDIKHQWVNGTIGRVQQLAQDHIEVEVIQNNVKFVFPVGITKWEIIKHRYDYNTRSISKEVVGSFLQYPLRLAWAVTIHKSQGLTFENVIIDLGSGAFAHGQTYVALSRCTNIEGVFLKKQLNQSDIIVDHPVIEFYRKHF